MRILVMFTGGTIGSAIQEGYIAPKAENESLLLEMYRSVQNKTQEFDVDVPYTILSENLNGSHITKLVHRLNMHLKKQIYDGIILTHGTDTLQYTSAALGILFHDVTVPVILVSSNYPLEDRRANGLVNFAAAVQYIENKRESGVYVSYKNIKEDVKIYDACSLLRHDLYSDEVRSLAGFEVEKSVGLNPYQCDSRGLESFHLCETSPVKYIVPYPGMTYDIPDESIRIILFGSYHAGTIQTESRGLWRFCEAMRERNIRMYICGVPGETGYESTRYYEELGIKVLPYGTDVYWYMMLWILNSENHPVRNP